MKIRIASICASFCVLLFSALSVQAGIIQVGSAFTLHPTNAPDSFSDTTTFGGTVLMDGGKVQLTMSQIVDGPNSEWDVWQLTTTDGSPIAGDPNSLWQITMDYVLSQNTVFDGVVNQWTFNGTPVSPINNFSGITGATSNVPALGGEGYYNSGFSDPIAAGAQIGWDEIFVNPYSFSASGGIPADANGINWALHFTSPAVAPLPSAVWGGLSLLVGVGLLKLRRRAAVK